MNPKLPPWAVRLIATTAIGIVSAIIGATIGWGRGIEQANTSNAMQIAILNTQLKAVADVQATQGTQLTQMNASMLALHAELTAIALNIRSK